MENLEQLKKEIVQELEKNINKIQLLNSTGNAIFKVYNFQVGNFKFSFAEGDGGDTFSLTYKSSESRFDINEIIEFDIDFKSELGKYLLNLCSECDIVDKEKYEEEKKVKEKRILDEQIKTIQLSIKQIKGESN